MSEEKKSIFRPDIAYQSTENTDSNRKLAVDTAKQLAEESEQFIIMGFKSQGVDKDQSIMILNGNPNLIVERLVDSLMDADRMEVREAFMIALMKLRHK